MTSDIHDIYLSKRLPAEWEPQQSVLVSLPDASMDWDYMLNEVLECYRGIVSALTSTGNNIMILTQSIDKAKALFVDIDPKHIQYVEIPLNDTWVRDYGPLTVEEESLEPRAESSKQMIALDCGFNGWGLKFAADCDNLATLHMYNSNHLFGLKYANHRNYVIEGGSIESDGKGTILTTSHCLCSENRNGGLCKEEVENHLHELFGATRILWLDHGALEGDDTDSHIDTLARLCPNNTILYVSCHNTSDSHYVELKRMQEELTQMRTDNGQSYKLIGLPLPEPIYDIKDGHRLPATYCNYLVTDDAVLVPAYGQPDNDAAARDIIQSVFPERKAISVDCRALIRQHGSLHCATMQIPKSI